MTATLIGANAYASFTYQAVPSVATAIILGGGTILRISQVGGFNDNAAPAFIYVQLHDKGIALAPGDVPFMTFYVPANGTFDWSPPNGRRVQNGLVFGVSSTRDTYTALAAPVFLFALGVETLN